MVPVRISYSIIAFMLLRYMASRGPASSKAKAHMMNCRRKFINNLSHIKSFLGACKPALSYCYPNAISSCIIGAEMIESFQTFELCLHRYFLSWLYGWAGGQE